MIDISAFKATIGVEASVDRLTYAELQERRALIAKRMDGRQKDAAEALGMKPARRRLRTRK